MVSGSFEKKGLLTKHWILFSSLALAVFLGVWYWKNTSNPDQQKNRVARAVLVEVEAARKASISRTITAAGTLRANQSVNIKAFVNGQVRKIYAQGGQEVGEGAPILALDDRKYRNRLQEAEAKLSFAKLELSRYQKLSDANSGPKKRQEKAETDYREALAYVDQAKKDIDECVIKAPFEGVITLNDISIGASVDERSELFTLVDMDPIKIDFRVPAQWLRYLSIGQSIGVKVDGFLDEKFEANIEAMDATVDPTAHTILVRGSIDNKKRILKPGLFARVELQVGSKDNAIVLPVTAVQVNGEQESVYKLTYFDKENVFVAARYPVVVGLQQGQLVEILRGVNPEDLVVVVGVSKIRDGSVVSFEGEKEYLDKFKKNRENKNKKNVTQKN